MTRSVPQSWFQHNKPPDPDQEFALPTSCKDLSRSYFDLFYHFVAIAIVLKSLSRARKKEVSGKSEATVTEPGVVTGPTG